MTFDHPSNSPGERAFTWPAEGLDRWHEDEAEREMYEFERRNQFTPGRLADHLGINNKMTIINKVEGVMWHDAPLPRKWHTCTAWTFASWWTDLFHQTVVERCACGAIRMPTKADRNPPFAEKNSRHAPSLMGTMTKKWWRFW